jgi:hypothetical protein
MAYLVSRFTDGDDGEIVLRGNKIADRRLMIVIGLMNLSLALTLLPWAYVGLLEETARVIDQFIVGLVSGIVAVPVTLLLARPYGVKIEDVAQGLVSSIRSRKLETPCGCEAFMCDAVRPVQ